MHTENRTLPGGAQETAGLVNGPAYHAQPRPLVVDWTSPRLRITRLRLLGDPGYPMWDVSYCHGELDGVPCQVQLPFTQLPRSGLAAAILAHARHHKVYAKGLGIFAAISTLL